MRTKLLFTTLILCIAMIASSAQSTELLRVKPDMSILPSDQTDPNNQHVWSFGPMDIPNPYFDVSGGTLNQDTMPLDYTDQNTGYFSYDLSAYSGTAQYWSLIVVAKVTDFEREATDGHYSGFGFGLAINGYEGSIAVMPDNLLVESEDINPGNNMQTFNGNEYHEFQIIGDMTTLTYDVYVDESLLTYGTNYPMNSYPNNFFWIGDATDSSNATASISYIEFWLTDSDPEPVATENESWGSVKSLFR